MTKADIVLLGATILPTILLMLGGQYIINLYNEKLKKKEVLLELIKSIKTEQYKSLNELYSIFGKFMLLYRKINFVKIKSDEEKYKVFQEIIEAESRIDSLILKIGSEFVYDNDNKKGIENMLGNLRQSVHIWRETFANGHKLPFTISNQEDYIRFKSAFAKTATFMSNKINSELNLEQIKLETSDQIICDAFDKKHEKWKDGHFYTGG